MLKGDYALIAAGVKDAEELTPWEHCPQPFDEWLETGTDTEASRIYWKAYNGRINGW
jgi:hypothetical protein